MRACEGCGRADTPALDYETPCNPKLCRPDADERPESHHDSCPKLIHEVRALYQKATLVHTIANPEGELEIKWRRDGWKMRKDGRDVFRWKMLCRPCIALVFEREARQKEYEKACKKARGETDQTYSQLLAEQANN